MFPAFALFHMVDAGEAYLNRSKVLLTANLRHCSHTYGGRRAALAVEHVRVIPGDKGSSLIAGTQSSSALAEQLSVILLRQPVRLWT